MQAFPRRAAAGALLCLVLFAGWAHAQLALIEQQAKSFLDGLAAKPPAPFTSFKYGSVQFDPASRTLTVTALELTSSTPADGPRKVTIARADLVDFNPFAVQKIVEPGQYRDGRGDGAFAAVLSSMVLRQVTLENPKNTSTFAAVQARNVSARQFDVAPTAANFPADKPGVGFALAAGAFRAEGLVMGGIVSTKADKSPNGSIERIALVGLDAGRLAEFTVDNFRGYDGDKEAVSIALIALRGLDLTRALPDLLAGKSIVFGDPARKPDFDELRIRGIGGAALAAQGVKLGEFAVGATRSADRLDERTTIRVSGFELGGATDPKSDVTAMLKDLGYPSIKADLVCGGGVNYGRRVTDIDKCDLMAPGLGTMSLAYSIANLRTDATMDDPMAALAAVQELTLERFRLSYKDESLADRLIAFAARQQGAPADRFRQQLIAQVRQGTAGMVQGSPRLQQAVQAVATFLAKPGAITFELSPAAPVRFGEFGPGMMADPAAAAEKLGVAVRSVP